MLFSFEKMILALILVFIPALGMDLSKLQNIDTIIESSLEQKLIPGAVVMVGRNDTIYYHKSFGLMHKESDKKMALDALFDIASLTKIFTAVSIMLLVEQGLLRLSDCVSKYIPEFNQKDKEKITVEHLLLHISGLPSSNDLAHYQGEISTLLQAIGDLQLAASIGTKFIYSDIGYILLGLIIQKVSNKSLDIFIRERILLPLEMLKSNFNPSEKLKENIAATQEREGALLQGQVHDPRAWKLGGIAGHAGLFSTAQDLSHFCRMFINQGIFKGEKFLSHLAFERMTKPHPLPDQKFRGLGWDIATEYSSCIGDLFKTGTLAHTGFTGTSIVIDLNSKTFVILLTNRVNMPQGNVVDLRAKVSNIVASAIA